MAPAQILDGKALAAKVKTSVAAELGELQARIPGFQPQLAIVQVSGCYTSSIEHAMYTAR